MSRLIPSVLNITVVDPSIHNIPVAVINAALKRMFTGIVRANGTWQQEPAAGWTIEHTAPGLYRIHHYQGNSNYSMSINAANSYTVDMTDQWFTVQITDNQGQPMDSDFAFSVSFN